MKLKLEMCGESTFLSLMPTDKRPVGILLNWKTHSGPFFILFYFYFILFHECMFTFSAIVGKNKTAQGFANRLDVSNKGGEDVSWCEDVSEGSD